MIGRVHVIEAEDDMSADRAAYGLKEDSHEHHAARSRGRATAGASTARQSLADVATQVIARIAAAITRELRIRRDMRQLMAMDQHMLRDIGLGRADIGGCVRYGRD